MVMMRCDDTEEEDGCDDDGDDGDDSVDVNNNDGCARTGHGHCVQRACQLNGIGGLSALFFPPPVSTPRVVASRARACVCVVLCCAVVCSTTTNPPACAQMLFLFIRARIISSNRSIPDYPRIFGGSSA
jgi:hypothetical protein